MAAIILKNGRSRPATFNSDFETESLSGPETEQPTSQASAFSSQFFPVL
jgi:hypothetical protein